LTVHIANKTTGALILLYALLSTSDVVRIAGVGATFRDFLAIRIQVHGERAADLSECKRPKYRAE